MGQFSVGVNILERLERHRIEHVLIQPGRPMQRLHREFRDECLNEHWFETLAQVREVVRV